MIKPIASMLAVALAAACGAATAQQPAPPPPAFAAPNLTEGGVRALAANCAACHGTNGKSAPGSPVAGLAGKPSAEIQSAMAQFRAGSKPATLMHHIAKGYSDADVAAIADYFSKQR
jgi:cytochrome c553